VKGAEWKVNLRSNVGSNEVKDNPESFQKERNIPKGEEETPTCEETHKRNILQLSTGRKGRTTLRGKGRRVKEESAVCRGGMKGEEEKKEGGAKK